MKTIKTLSLLAAALAPMLHAEDYASMSAADLTALGSSVYDWHVVIDADSNLPDPPYPGALASSLTVKNNATFTLDPKSLGLSGAVNAAAGTTIKTADPSAAVRPTLAAYNYGNSTDYRTHVFGGASIYEVVDPSHRPGNVNDVAVANNLFGHFNTVKMLAGKAVLYDSSIQVGTNVP